MLFKPGFVNCASEIVEERTDGKMVSTLSCKSSGQDTNLTYTLVCVMFT